MAHEISPTDVDGFCKKLEGFSNSLSDQERTILKTMLEGGLSDQALSNVHGGMGLSLLQSGIGGFRSFSVLHFAPRLDSSFFRTLMSW